MCDSRLPISSTGAPETSYSSSLSAEAPPASIVDPEPFLSSSCSADSPTSLDPFQASLQKDLTKLVRPVTAKANPKSIFYIDEATSVENQNQQNEQRKVVIDKASSPGTINQGKDEAAKINGATLDDLVGIHFIQHAFYNDEEFAANLQSEECDVGDRKAGCPSTDEGAIVREAAATATYQELDDEVFAARLQHEEYNARDRDQNADHQSANIAVGREMDPRAAFEEVDDEGFAARLQNEEFCIEDTDAAFASQLQEEDRIVQSSDVIDYEQQQQHAFTMQREAEDYAMMSSSSGVAWKLVERVLQVASSSNFTSLGVDDMVFLAERFIEKQNDFDVEGKPSFVTIAYHNTNPLNLEGIRQSGLMTPSEQLLTHQTATHQSALRNSRGHFGEGIYTANNPEAFRNYGSRGILVAILKGNTKRIDRSGMQDISIDAGVGNKQAQKLRLLGQSADLLKLRYGDETVLRMASQCFPLVYYDASATFSSETANRLWDCHTLLQKVMDTFFNKGIEVAPTRVAESKSCLPQHQPLVSIPRPRYSLCRKMSRQQSRCSQQNDLRRNLPVALASPDMSVLYGSLSYKAPHILESPKQCRSLIGAQMHDIYNIFSVAEAVNYLSSDDAEEKCQICFSDFDVKSSSSIEQALVQVTKCKHVYHRECFEKALQFSTKLLHDKCPICRGAIGEPRGMSPSGTMNVSRTNRVCEGHESDSIGSLVIKYEVDGGFQKRYHVNPGARFRSSNRTAFIPCTAEALDLVKRLKWA